MLLQWVFRLKSDICRCFKFLGHFAEDSSSQINVSWSEDKAFTKRWCWLWRNGCRCAFHFTLQILPQVLPQRGHEWMTVKVWDWYTRFISDIKYDWWFKVLHWVREFTSFKVWRCSTGFGRKNWTFTFFWHRYLCHSHRSFCILNDLQRNIHTLFHAKAEYSQSPSSDKKPTILA